MRLFIAVLLEPPLLAALRDIQARLRRLDATGGVRWVDPAGIHLTLKFLGEVDGERAPAIAQSLTPALEGLPAAMLGLGAMGAFPSRKRPRVLWLGLRESGQALAQVQGRVEAACASMGWEPEKRVFQPHLTVGRVRQTGSARSLSPDLLKALDEDPSGSTSPSWHPRVALMRSHLSPKGARYEEVRVWHLSVPESPGAGE